MATQNIVSHTLGFHNREDEVKTAKVVGGGAGTEIFFGIGAIVLSILGLVKIYPAYMLAITCIALGISFLAQGLSIADRYDALTEEFEKNRKGTTGFSGGIGSEFAGGLTALALGILTLVKVGGGILIPIAAIVLGVTLLLSTGTVSEFRYYALRMRKYAMTEKWSQQALQMASGTQILVGLGAAVLGILALLGIAPFTLSLVAFLAVAFATVVTGLAVGGRMAFIIEKQ